MPSFKGPMPSQKGPVPSYKGPRPAQKGPIPSFKGPYPSQKGPMSSFEGQMNRPSFNGNPWYQPQAPSNTMTGYPAGNTEPTFQSNSFETYPDHQQPEINQAEPVPVPQDPDRDVTPEEHEPITDFQGPPSDHHSTAIERSETEPVPNAQVPSGGSETNRGK